MGKGGGMHQNLRGGRGGLKIGAARVCDRGLFCI